MSDPRYGSPRFERSGRYRDDLSADDPDNGAGIWLMVVMGIAAAMALTWLSVAPLQNTHETAATGPAQTQLETTGQADRASPLIRER
jgi:hypothetical protein